MGWEIIGLIVFTLMFILLIIGLPVSVALLITVLFGFVAFVHPALGVSHVINTFYSSVSKFTLTPVPLFILVGNLLFHSGVARRCIECISRWTSAMPARLSFMAVAAGTLFGAISGSTLASFSLLSSVLYPEMRQQKYSKGLSIGSILASGGLAMIIPPSALSVFYAAVAQISVAGILIAGIIPGILMAAGYSLVILIRVAINPSSAPKYEVEDVPWRERWRSLAVDQLPAAFITVLMLTFILFGITTPTEAASVGFVASLIVIIAYRQLNWEVLKKSITSTMQTTCMIFFITISADGYSRLLAHTGVSPSVVKWVIGLDLPPLVTIVAMLLLVVVLGTFMDQVPIILITVPFFVPIVQTLGYNMVWFAIMMLIALQIGLTTPPFGLGLFLVKGVIPDIKTTDLYLAAAPYLLSDAAVTTLILFFPALALYVPATMNLL